MMDSHSPWDRQQAEWKARVGHLHREQAILADTAAQHRESMERAKPHWEADATIEPLPDYEAGEAPPGWE